MISHVASGRAPVDRVGGTAAHPTGQARSVTRNRVGTGAHPTGQAGGETRNRVGTGAHPTGRAGGETRNRVGGTAAHPTGQASGVTRRVGGFPAHAVAGLILAAQLIVPTGALAQQAAAPANAPLPQQGATKPEQAPARQAPGAAAVANAPPQQAASAKTAQPRQTPAAAPTQPIPPASFQPPAAPATGSLLQTLLALCFVLALLAALAWFMKRYGPKAGGGAAHLRVVSSLSLGGRERIVVIEVADQWIVVGASPGRVNALATMPKQEGVEPSAALAANVPSGFADWLKQTIEKRNAK